MPPLACDRRSTIYLTPDGAELIPVIEIADKVGPNQNFKTYAWVHADCEDLARRIVRAGIVETMVERLLKEVRKYTDCYLSDQRQPDETDFDNVYGEVLKLEKEYQALLEPDAQEYRQAAKAEYTSEGINIETDAPVTPGHDGAWVQAWVWVDNPRREGKP